MNNLQEFIDLMKFRKEKAWEDAQTWTKHGCNAEAYASQRESWAFSVAIEKAELLLAPKSKEDVETPLHKTPVMPSLLDFKAQRLKAGLTLRQVQQATGISNAYLSQLENKKIGKPSFDVVQKLSDFYASNGA